MQQKQITLKKGFGYWDSNINPNIIKIDRFSEDTPAILLGECECKHFLHGEEVRVLLNDGREVVTINDAIVKQ